MSKLLVIRGATGSGKSSVANYIHNYVIGHSVLLPQDVYKVDFIKGEPELFKATLDALESSAQIYLKSDALVIVEGVFSKKHWEDMLIRLAEGTEAYLVYLDTSLETALHRASQRKKSDVITEDEVKLWHPKSKPLELANEVVISADNSNVKEIAEQIANVAGLKFDINQPKALLFSDSFHPAPNV